MWTYHSIEENWYGILVRIGGDRENLVLMRTFCYSKDFRWGVKGFFWLEVDVYILYFTRKPRRMICVMLTKFLFSIEEFEKITVRGIMLT